MRKEIVAQLDNIDLTTIDENIYEIESLEREDSLIVDAYFKLGKDYIEKVDYNENEIKIALIKKSVENGESIFEMTDALLDTFIVDREYTVREIKSTLNKIYKEFDIDKKATGTELSDYFNLSPRKTIWGRKKKGETDPKGYTILSAKYTKRKPGQKVDLFNQD